MDEGEVLRPGRADLELVARAEHAPAVVLGIREVVGLPRTANDDDVLEVGEEPRIPATFRR